ncbi:MAG: heavy metal sensor histidine kinase [Burkholderiales bacterium]
MSLATRLGLLFATLATLAFGIAGYHLYHPFSHQFRARDDAALVSIVNLLRDRLKDFDSVAAVGANPGVLLDVVDGRKGLFLTIRDSRGVLLATSSRNYALLPAVPPFVVSDDLGAIGIRDWQESGGVRGHIISAWAKVNDSSGSRVMLLLAQEERQQMTAELEAHRKDAAWTIVAGALATIFFGYVIARRGLQPLRALAKTAGEITVHQLGERLRIEDAPPELEEMVRAFNLMLDRLEDSFRRLTQFSSDIAHDLRTPISNLMVETQVTLAQRRSVQEYEELLVSNVEEYERLTRMIENMLFLAHAENAQVTLRREMLSIETELKRIGEYFEGMAEEAGISLDVIASGSLAADAILFRRAVSNLVVNAIRYTTPGGCITMRGYPRAGGRFVIEVSNPGVGIPSEHLPRIFDRFYRVDTSRVQSHISSGLGLSIVKSIAVLHGGSVEVESVPNGLTTFRLIFKG